MSDAALLIRAGAMPPPDPSLKRRVEFKYVLRHGDVATLRAHLRGTCRPLVHRHAFSTVRSIYFDDARLTCCRGNLDGLALRKKYRVRWYDAPEPESDLFFEVKWRRNRVTGKKRTLLRVDPELLRRRYTEIVPALATALGDEAREALLRHPHPVVLVEYRREHFVSPDGRFRWTLDYDIRFTDQASRIRPRLGAPRGRRGIGRWFLDETILEAKCNPGDGAELRRFLHPLVQRPTRSSKYVRGCHAIGLIRSFG